MGCVQVLGTVLAALIIDRTGRRKLLSLSAIVMSASAIGLGKLLFIALRETIVPPSFMLPIFRHLFLHLGHQSGRCQGPRILAPDLPVCLYLLLFTWIWAHSVAYDGGALPARNQRKSKLNCG